MNLKLISYNCNICGEQLIPDVYDNYICVGCGGQVNPAVDSKREVKRQIREAMNSYKSLSLQEGERVHGGGSKSKSYGRKDKLRKPSTHRLWERLSS